jgi:hypothetical protein
MFKKYSKVKFHENSFSENEVVACRQTDGPTGRRIDMTKLTDAFRNFAKAPKTISNKSYSKI